jgi:hypothetical protein
MRVAGAHVPGPLAERTTRLLERFGVGERRAEILGCIDLVCGESLQEGAGRSSLNADGTPLQLALSVTAGQPAAFEFVGEAFVAGADGYEARRAIALHRMRTLAETIGVGPELGAVRPRLEALAGAGRAGDGEDGAGAFWLGASFAPVGEAAMTVYGNVRRGNEAGRWQRLAAFAGGMGSADWSSLLETAETSGLSPLGAGVHLRPGGSTRCRLYFRAYGRRPDEHRRMFGRAGGGGAFDRALAGFFEELLGAGRIHPTRSAVVSFGSDAEAPLLPKLELCAHCAWSTDAEAAQRCQSWLTRSGLDAGLYRDALGILAGGREAPGAAMIHTFVGAGMRRGTPYASMYLNPGRHP